MDEKKPDPLNDGFAAREKIAGRQGEIMARFYGRLTGPQRRAMRRAALKVTGRKETFAQQAARINREEQERQRKK